MLLRRETTRWGVMDDRGHVTECPSERDAREHQSIQGEELVNRVTIHTVRGQEQVRASDA